MYIHFYMHMHIFSFNLAFLYAKAYNNDPTASLCQEQKEKTESDASRIRGKSRRSPHSHQKNRTGQRQLELS